MFEAHIKITWKAVGLTVGSLVAVLFLVVLVQEVSSLVRGQVQGQAKAKSGVPARVTAENANFAYLVPSSDVDWTFDPTTVVTDQAKGVVKYEVALEQGKANINISQQQLPADLMPKGSDKYEAFIQSQKPVQSQQAGGGTVYFLPALENGAPSKDADTVIYATDSTLMFGRSSAIVDYPTWAKLLASMGPPAKQ